MTITITVRSHHHQRHGHGHGHQRHVLIPTWPNCLHGGPSGVHRPKRDRPWRTTPSRTEFCQPKCQVAGGKALLSALAGPHKGANVRCFKGPVDMRHRSLPHPLSRRWPGILAPRSGTLRPRSSGANSRPPCKKGLRSSWHAHGPRLQQSPPSCPGFTWKVTSSPSKRTSTPTERSKSPLWIFTWPWNPWTAMARFQSKMCTCKPRVSGPRAASFHSVEKWPR